MSNIELTIITVTYNCEKTLQRTIDSVYKQQSNLYEYLIIDGGSTDETIGIIKKNIDKFNGKLRYISEPDDGLYDAMNKGIKLASGKYIGIINGDDYYYDISFDNIINDFKIYDVDILYSDLLFSSKNQIFNQKPLRGDHEKLPQRMSVNHPTCFVKKSTYEKNGYFDLAFNIAADYELMARFFVNGCKFKKTSNILSVMELGGLSSNNSKTVNEKYEIHKRYFGKSHAIKYKFKNVLLYYYRKTKSKYSVNQ